VIVLVVVLENCIALWSLDVSVISLGLMVVVVIVVVRKAEVGVVAAVVVLMVVSSTSSIANVVGTSCCKTKCGVVVSLLRLALVNVVVVVQ